MSKITITILCPSGHRRKAQVTPNTNLLQILEDTCRQENLDSSEWGLIHQRKKCDLTIPWRLSAIPTNALLEMYKLEERRATSDVTIQLQLPDNARCSGNFKPEVTLREMLDLYRTQSESKVAVLDASINNDDKLSPVCSYMSEDVIGDYALSNTTLRELGLTNGTAVIRYNYRSINDDELNKIKERIDNKIARRQQQSTPVQSSPSPPATTMSLPLYSEPVITVPLFNNDEFSIFRDRPAYQPQTTTSQQPRTLAESLGLNISLDSQPFRQQETKTDFSNFKFPEATKGQDLHRNESDKFNNRQSSNLPDRHTIAYDLSTIPTSKNINEEIPDSFFELTPDDLRSVLNTLRQQGVEENPLETRLMRERARSTRAAAYQYIVIRFVVNSNNVLQGLFYPTEPISNLIEFVRTNLICSQIGQSDFYLYTSPPRVVLSEVNKSLSTYDLIPAAYVYLGHRKISPLVVQLAPNIKIGTIGEANQIVTQFVYNRTDSNLTTKQNSSVNNIDDKQLRDKLRKFLPGQK